MSRSTTSSPDGPQAIPTFRGACSHHCRIWSGSVVAEASDGAFRVAARLPVEDLGELFAGRFRGTPREDELREALESAAVDTVGGLLAQRLGKVPLPGAPAELEGLLSLEGEGGKDARGRIRITSVLVSPLEPADADSGGSGDDTRDPIGDVPDPVAGDPGEHAGDGTRAERA